MVQGYNVAITLGGKTILGRTQEDLTIAAKVKESITKDDAGVRKKAVTGHDVSFKISALLSIDSSTSATTKMDRDDAIALALSQGSSAIFALTYTCSGGQTYGGNAIITGYSESTAADPDTDSTVSLDIQIVGAFAAAQ